MSCTAIKEDSRGLRCVLGNLDGISVSTTRAAASKLLGHGEDQKQ